MNKTDLQKSACSFNAKEASPNFLELGIEGTIGYFSSMWNNYPAIRTSLKSGSIDDCVPFVFSSLNRLWLSLALHVHTVRMNAVQMEAKRGERSLRPLTRLHAENAWTTNQWIWEWAKSQSHSPMTNKNLSKNA